MTSLKAFFQSVRLIFWVITLFSIVACGGGSGGNSSNTDSANQSNSTGNTPDNTTSIQYTKENLHKHTCLDLPYSVQNDLGECGDIFDFQCGTKIIAGGRIDYGSCPTGYECNDNLCIASNTLTCEDVTCGNNEDCVQGICLLTPASGASRRFVATWGNDTNPGTIDQPFQSWQKAVEESHPGDITYIRGGVWYKTEHVHPGHSALGMLIRPGEFGRNGTENSPIKYYNFPGERPILDGSLAEPNQFRWLTGISLSLAEHIHLKGLTVRHIHQDEPHPDHQKPNAQVSGIATSGANLKFENMVVHNINGRGFEHWSRSWSEADAQIGYEVCVDRNAGEASACEVEVAEFASDNTSWINCDAYNLYDWSSTQPGNHADGWKVGTYSTGEFLWKGCRAWNYSDDGFDPHGYGKRIFVDSWASSGTKYRDMTDIWSAEGNGFKTTGVYIAAFPNYVEGGEPNVEYKRTIAAHCIGRGYFNNLYIDYDKQWPNNALYYNTLSYLNDVGYTDKSGSTFYNNIVYNSTGIGVNNTPTEIGIPQHVYTEANNTWVAQNPAASWPHYLYNELFSVTNEDFVSLDVSELTKMRKEDFSLPDISFGQHSSTSELIDAGRVIDGFHCPTAGEHQGANCVEWFGSAPDLGPFERRQ